MIQKYLNELSACHGKSLTLSVRVNGVERAAVITPKLAASEKIPLGTAAGVTFIAVAPGCVWNGNRKVHLTNTGISCFHRFQFSAT
jgi:hypothetical protein